MSQAANQAEPGKQPTTPPQASKPRMAVLGVTLYDRVVSFLISLIVILLILSAPFGAIWLAERDWDWLNRRPPPQVEVVEVIEDVLGGGEETGVLDSSLYAPGPEGPEVSTAANPDDVIADTSSVDMEQTIKDVLNAVGTAIQMSDQLMMSADIGTSALPSGNPKGTGRHRNLGKGPGDGGGVKRSERWEIVFPEGQSEVEYSRQLDYFRVELGAIVGSKLFKVSNLSKAVPDVKQVPNAQDEKQLYFSWRGGSRRQIDLNLLRKAGSKLPLEGNVIVLQFYPANTENQLAVLEQQYLWKEKGQGTRMETVRKTKFAVSKEGAGYRFDVIKQEYFGQPPSKG